MSELPLLQGDDDVVVVDDGDDDDNAGVQNPMK